MRGRVGGTEGGEGIMVPGKEGLRAMTSKKHIYDFTILVKLGFLPYLY